jgi:hypothetical protein
LDRLGGPQSCFGHCGEEKNSQPLSELEPPIIQPVAQRYTAELYQLTVQLRMKIGFNLLIKMIVLIEIFVYKAKCLAHEINWRFTYVAT